MTLKKVLLFILIIIVLTEVFFGLFSNVPKAFAWGEGMETANAVANAQSIIDNGEWPWPLNYIPDVVYYVAWTPASWLMGIGGYVMDKGIDFSISGPVFSSLAKSEAVTKGWSLGRDIVNLFLIFILLYIAIATILQLSGYGAKQLLTTLIIVAFLVNFSLVITRLVVDAANILTTGFYDSFEKGADGKISISNTFKNALDSEKIVGQKKAIDPKSSTPTLVRLLSMLLGIIVMLIAGFIFLIFGILFVIRAVVLVILMILSPLAFAAHVLPSTKKHASTWWHQLFSQAFFAPAAMFMLWIAAQVAAQVQSSTFQQAAFGTNNVAIIDMVSTNNWDGIAKFVLQFTIIVSLLCSSLILAKQLGAIGADAAQKGVKQAGRKFQGYAGKIGRLGRRGAGLAAEGILKSEGKTAGRIKSLPLVSRGLAGASAWEKERSEKKTKEYAKSYGTYSDAGLKTLVKDPTIFGERRKGLLMAIAQNEEKDKKKKAPKEREKIKLEQQEKRVKSQESLEKVIQSGSIREIMAEMARISLLGAEAAALSRDAAEEAKETAESAKETAEKTKETAEKTKETAETAKASTPPPPPQV